MTLSLVTVAWGKTMELRGIIYLVLKLTGFSVLTKLTLFLPVQEMQADQRDQPVISQTTQPASCTCQVSRQDAARRILRSCTASACHTPSCLPPSIPSQPQPRHPHVPISARDEHRLASSPPQHKKLLLFAAVTMETLGSGLRLFYLRCS